MAHGHHHDLKDSIENQTGRASLLLIGTMMGGLLVANSFIAEWVFDSEQYAAAFALMGAIILGTKLIWHSLVHLMHGEAHMDELVSMAILAAIAIGKYQEAGIIAFFMVISTLIETRTALGARASIQGLIHLTPSQAQVVAEDGTETQVDARRLKAGDVIRVRPGDNIAADGVVLKGESTINQANITGESIPVDKGTGEEVFGGTTNLTGMLEIRVSKAGEDTTLGRVQKLILDAERTRIPLMRIIDQYAGWYTPTIIMLAGIVWFLVGKEEGITRAITMLVVACPCALVLATPTAMVAALSCAARLGILVKNVVTLEGARNLTAVMFDKTGTLTTGELSVTQMRPLDGIEGTELLRAAASADQMSKHPNARALTAVATKARLKLNEPHDFEEVAGQGVSANVNGEPVLVGRRTFLESRGIDMSPMNQDAYKEPEGVSVLYVSRGGGVIGWIGLEDRTRDEAREAMNELRELGVRNLTMVTGDKWSVARRVSEEMGTTDVHAEVLPARKLELVDELKASGHRVAVVGDGVNDAPALAAGDLSVAMGAAGSDVAIESASIALMNNDLRRLPFLIKLSRATARVIWQNLVFGILFIIILEVLGAMGLINPMLAAALHLVSSTIVLFNSARLVRFGEHLQGETPLESADRPRGETPPQTPPPSVAPMPA